jgi:hypothetical protein
MKWQMKGHLLGFFAQMFQIAAHQNLVPEAEWSVPSATSLSLRPRTRNRPGDRGPEDQEQHWTGGKKDSVWKYHWNHRWFVEIYSQPVNHSIGWMWHTVTLCYSVTPVWHQESSIPVDTYCICFFEHIYKLEIFVAIYLKNLEAIC